MTTEIVVNKHFKVQERKFKSFCVILSEFLIFQLVLRIHEIFVDWISRDSSAENYLHGIVSFVFVPHVLHLFIVSSDRFTLNPNPVSVPHQIFSEQTQLSNDAEDIKKTANLRFQRAKTELNSSENEPSILIVHFATFGPAKTKNGRHRLSRFS